VRVSFDANGRPHSAHSLAASTARAACQLTDAIDRGDIDQLTNITAVVGVDADLDNELHDGTSNCCSHPHASNTASMIQSEQKS
jgi:hypothetical protein